MAPRTSWKHVSDEAARDTLLKKESVNRWLRGIVADNRVKEVNVLHRYLLFRKRKGLEAVRFIGRMIEQVQSVDKRKYLY